MLDRTTTTIIVMTARRLGPVRPWRSQLDHVATRPAPTPLREFDEHPIFGLIPPAHIPFKPAAQFTLGVRFRTRASIDVT